MTKRDQRYSAKYPVVLRKGPEMYSGTICNISYGGGCVIGVPSLKTGDTIVLDYGDGQTRATAVWTMARMTGLKFESRISWDCLNAIRLLPAHA